MSQALIYTLLALALVLPLIGAGVLRVFFSRLSEVQGALIVALVFGTAIASVLVLARSNADNLRIGNLTLLLPATAPDAADFPAPEDLGPPPTRPPLPTVRTTNTPTPVVTATVALSATIPFSNTAAVTGTLAPTATATLPAPSATVVTPTLTLTATAAPTATVTPTLEIAPTPTQAPPPPTAVPPTAVPPTAAPPAPAPRTYTVQAGDTLRSIAAKFNVSVADLLRANNLTAAQADSLRPGQVLKIP